MLLRQALLILGFLASLNGFSQFTKGTRIVGASVVSAVVNSGSADVSVATIGSTTSKITGYGISISPSMGWFISDKTAVGALLNINPTGDKNTFELNGSTFQSDKNTNFNIGIGGFVRNYFNTTGSFKPFLQASINAGISSYKKEGFFYGSSPLLKRTYDGSSTGGFFTNAAFTIGLTKMIGEYTGLDLYLGYNYSYNKNTFKKTTLVDLGNDGSVDERQENETTTKFTNHGFLLGVGFQIFLKGKK